MQLWSIVEEGIVWYGISSFRRWLLLSFIQWPTWGGPTVEAVIEGDYRDSVLLVWYGIIIYSRLLASSSKVQVVERLVRLFTKERNPEVVDNLNKISGMFCLNFCQVFKDLNPRTSFDNASVWNASHSVI